MPSDVPTLHMVTLRLDVARLMQLGIRRRLPMRDVDPGYLVHCHFGELFGDLSPRTFSLASERGREWSVLAYADHDAATLRAHADAYADPALHSAVAWESFASKQMPTDWKSGQLLGFEVRACPIVRKSGDGPNHRKGAEVDAFLAKCWAVGPTVKVDREAVYREWLEQQIGRHGGSDINSAQVVAYQRERFVRRTQGDQRVARVSERPDVLFRGTLRVRSAAEFSALLRRGVGRHRGFGFGMLLLRPVRPEC